MERKSNAETLASIPDPAVQQEYIKYLTACSEAETARAKAKEAQANATLKLLENNHDKEFAKDLLKTLRQP